MMINTKNAALFTLMAVVIGMAARGGRSVSAPSPPPLRPSLNVEIVRPELRELPLALAANGSIAAWQETIISAEVGGLRLTEVQAQLGDSVHKGQVLAEFDPERVETDITQSQATVAEAEANLEDARLNVERAKQVADSGAMSAQQMTQYLTTAKTAEARCRSAKAQLAQQQRRLRHVKVLASDDGIIASRSATHGAVVAEGQELFRLIRQNRLEWRAEVTASELKKLKPGLKVTVEVPGTAQVTGKVRLVAPMVNERSRSALVYVDLPNAVQAGLRPGMFAHGEFHLGSQAGWVVPQTALSLRDGFSYVFRLSDDGGQARANQVKVQLGRRMGDRVEITAGVTSGDRLVTEGAAFLDDGDIVKVVGP